MTLTTGTPAATAKVIESREADAALGLAGRDDRLRRGSAVGEDLELHARIRVAPFSCAT